MVKKPQTRDVLLGPIELLIMKAVIALEDDAYGITIFDAVRTVYASMSFGSVYTALERLTWKGYLESRMGEPEPTRGGRAKKYYRATALGKKAKEGTLKSLTSPILIGGSAVARS
jgi:PadR family transcriptional regulator PadR